MKDNLASAAARGVILTLVGQWVKFLVQLVALIVLARILDPQSFGQYAIVMAFTGLALIIGDFGLSLATIQAKTVSRDEQSNVFWVNIALGSALGLLTLAAAWPIGHYYGDGRITQLMSAMSLLFVINGAAAQYRANATRELAFRRLAVGDVVAQIGGLGAAITLGVVGAEAWALVAQILVSSFLFLLLAAWRNSFRPSWPKRDVSVRRFVRFGAGSMGVQLVNYVSANVDSLVLGRVVGLAQLGVYDRAYQLFKVPMQQVASPMSRVALPILSRLVEDRERYSAYLRRAQQVSGYVLVSTFAVAAAASDALVALVLGTSWSDAAAIFRLLAVGGAFQGLGYVFYWVFLSMGRPDLHLRFTIVGRSFAIVAIVVGALTYGTHGAAIGMSAGYVIIWTVYNQLAMPKLGFRPGFLLAVVWRPLLFGGAVFGSGFAAASAAPGTLSSLALALTGSLAGALGAGLIIPGVRKDLAGVWRTVLYARSNRG